MRIGNTAVKATGMASVIFWIIILPELSSDSVIALIPLSLIPIFICCLFTIVFTVFPVFWFLESTLSKQQIFKIYFPYYAIVVFTVSSIAIHQFKYDVFAIAFFTSAFFTLLQTWVWISKQDLYEKV